MCALHQNLKHMKKAILLLLTVFFVNSIMMAQAPKLSAKKGVGYGEKITADGAVSPDDVTDLLQNKESVDIKIKGKVVDVCHARGCFLYLKTATGKIYIKTKDDAFFVPVALEGKTVIVKGTASVDKDTKKIAIQATAILVF
jgi:uncharacterized protein YdeI (BOF family)